MPRPHGSEAVGGQADVSGLYPPGCARSRRYVITSFEFPPAFGGGIGTYTAAMARALAVHGHRTTVVTVAEESTHRREHIDIGPHGIEVVRVPAPRTCGPEPAATLRAWIDLSDRFADYLHRLIRVEGDAIDAIEFPEYRGEGLAFLSSTTPGKRPPCVVRLHTPCLVLGR